MIGATIETKHNKIPMTDFAILCDLMIATIPQISPVRDDSF